MAAKRGREKAAGLRRLNVAVKPEVLDRLAGLMILHNCGSQAGVIELLVMAGCAVSEFGTAREYSNEVLAAMTETAIKAPPENPQKKTALDKAHNSETTGITELKKLSPTQMGLF